MIVTAFVKKDDRAKQVSLAPVLVDVRTQKVRLPEGLRGTTGNPAVSPESAADNIRL